MEEDIFISVVLCTYNGEAFLSEQLQSILHQTHENFELIVCDDRSTDGTVGIVKGFAEKDERVKIFVNEENLGIKKNFEKALGLAQAQWIAISDQDDVWVLEKLEKLIKAISPGTLLVHSYNVEFKGTDLNRAVYTFDRNRFCGNDTKQLLFYNTIYGHALLLKKELLNYALPFPDKTYYDWWLGVIATFHGKVGLSGEALVYHREHDLNSSRAYYCKDGILQKQLFFEDRAAMLQEFLSIPLLNEDDKKLAKEFRSLLLSEWQKKFSIPVFKFFIRNASSAFYYRKKSGSLFYRLKYSYKKATMKTKYWL